MFLNSFKGRALFIVLGASAVSISQAQLRVATWNITNYTSGRTAAFQTAIFSSFEGRSMNPDVLVVQEIKGTTGVNNFLNLLNSAPGQAGQWAAGTPFISTGDSDSAMFYRKSKVDFVALANISGDPRATQRYDFKLKGYGAGSTMNPNVSYYSSHLKSGDGGTDEARRLTETTNIRHDAATRPAGTQFLIGGDFNVKTSADDGYNRLVAPSVSTDGTAGRFYDPINSSFTSGGGTINWNSSTYRVLHTQDPFGAGGMDDRYDFILTGGSLRDGKGLEYIGSATDAYSLSTWNDPNHSYRVWGNDGTSYDTTLTTTGNTMVGATIAQALRDSTGNTNPANTGGHLPIFLDMKVPADLAASAASLNFGTVTVGSIANQNLTISNAVDAMIWGTAAVQNLNYQFSLTGSGFIAPSGTFNLLAGQSLGSVISMNTATAGSRSAILNVFDTVTGQTSQVNLSGLVLVPEPASMIALGLGAVALLRRKRK